MLGLDGDSVSELGGAMVAVTITIGIIVLTALGKPLDGLEAGFLAVIGAYFGGSLTKAAANRAAQNTRDTAVQSQRNSHPVPAAQDTKG